MADGYVELTVEKLKTGSGLAELNRMLRDLYDNVAGDMDTVRDYKGYGAPTFSAGVGSTYRRLDGGVGTSFYVKESGGWQAK